MKVAVNRILEAIDVSPVTFWATASVVLLSVILYVYKKKSSIPGPWGLPYLGMWPFLKTGIAHLQLQDYMKKYGDVYGFTFTGYLYIHMGTIKAVREVHLNKADCFTQRYSDFSIASIIFGDGIALSNGEKWRHLRKFFTQSFKEFGMLSAKEVGSGTTYETLNNLIGDLLKPKGAPVDIINVLTIRCCKIINRMLFNEDGVTVEELLDINRSYEKILLQFSGEKILLLGEFARRVILPLTPGFSGAIKERKHIDDALRRIIRRHEQNFDETNVRDLIDFFLKERHDRRKKGDPSEEYFTESTLVSSLVQFIGDGILSVAIFMGYFIYALLEYPEEQDKLYDEIVSVVGTNRQVSIEDKNKLPYVNAFLQEVTRMSDFFPLFPTYECTKETTLHGIKVPKGAIAVMNIWAAQRDPKIYKNPDQFNPSRYIATNGKQKVEPPVLFGIGKRACVGEAFTMMLSFLFITTIVKNFRLTSPHPLNKTAFFESKMDICAHPRSNK